MSVWQILIQLTKILFQICQIAKIQRRYFQAIQISWRPILKASGLK